MTSLMTNELVASIAIEVDKELDRVEARRCSHESTVDGNPKIREIHVKCNLIRGHTIEKHSNGFSEWE